MPECWSLLLADWLFSHTTPGGPEVVITVTQWRKEMLPGVSK
jgi:hypothetical protein